ncbi:MAG: glycosyltransferase family 39 protein, partial [Candidatus Roizmanbacteria bacterium]
MFNYLFTKTPLMFLVQSLWRDEAFSYFLAKKNVLEIFTLSAKDFSPPLYHLILHFWINIFGGSEIALRSLSIIFYWATVYVGFLFLTDFFKMKLKKAFFYTFLIAINPLLLYYAFESRMYSTLAFFGTFSFYSLYKKKSTLYFLSLILGLYTHYFMIFVVVAQYFLIRSKKQIHALLVFLPWIIFVLINRGIVVDSFWIQKFSVSNLINFIGSIYTGYEGGFKFFDKSIFLFSMALWFIIALGYMQIKKNIVHEGKLFKYLFAWAILIPLFTVLVSFIKPVFLPRYLIFSATGLIILLIFAIEKFPLFLRVLIIIFIFTVTFNYNCFQIKERKKANLRKTIKEIKVLMKDSDSLYVSSELDYFTALYYLRENKVYIWGKTYEEIPNYVGKALIPKEKIASTLPFYPKKAYVLSPDG